MERNYKLRIYYKSGFQKGNLKREEFFSTKESMQQRYRELFKPKEYALNPTAWERINGEWLRPRCCPSEMPFGKASAYLL